MKCGVVLLATFAFVLIEVLPSKIDFVQEIESNAVSHVEKRSTSDEIQDSCYEDFEFDEWLLLGDFQSEMVNCKQNAENAMKSISIRQLSVQVAGKIHSIQESFKDCNLMGHPSEYLECLKNFGFKSRTVLDEIDELTEQFKIKTNALKEKEQSCQTESLNQSKLKSQTSLLKLKRCLQIKSTLTEVSYLDEIQQIYNDLDYCVTIEQGHDFAKCMERAKKTLNNNQLKEHIELNAPRYYKELSKIDQDQNSCIRHFITEYVHPEFKSSFSLNNCLWVGLRRVTSSFGLVSELSVINNDFFKLREQLYRCTLISRRDENADECASEILKKSDESRLIGRAIHKMTDGVFKSKVLPDILVNLGNETTCARHIFEALQFEGLFMDVSARQALKGCLRTQYTNSESVPSDVVIDRLKEIANSLRMCCISFSADYFKCTDDAVNDSKISLDYITTEPRYSSLYKSYIEEYDSTENNFLTILDSYTDPPYSKIMAAFHCMFVE